MWQHRYIRHACIHTHAHTPQRERERGERERERGAEDSGSMREISSLAGFVISLCAADVHYPAGTQEARLALHLTPLTGIFTHPHWFQEEVGQADGDSR